MANFPGSRPATRTYSTTEHLSDMAAIGHIALHQSHEGELAALSDKVGLGSSTPSNGYFLMGNGAGTSVWRAGTKSDVGLSNVDNTSDSTKNSASATLTNKTLSTGSVIDANVTVTEVLKKVYPVGSIYINATDSTNPATLLGFGTWSAFGAGRVPVGLNSGDTDFDTAEKTGGAKTNTHNHYTGYSYDGANFFSRWHSALPRSRVISSVDRIAPAFTSANGTAREDSTYDETISVVQPYIVVYMWKRTA